MNLVIDGNLSYPPSELSCLRDITLYSDVYSDLTVIVQIWPELKDEVWYKLKSAGAMDFVYEIVDPEVDGIVISDAPGSDIQVDCITCDNLGFIINRLRPWMNLPKGFS